MEPLWQFGNKLGLPAPCSIAFDPRLDRVKQFLLTQGLGQEFNRSRFYCPHGHGYVAVTANEYDWKRDAQFDQGPLKFQPARPWQSDVEYDAARRIGTLALNEVLRRPKHLHAQPDGAKQILDGITHHSIIVDNEHNGLFLCHATALADCIRSNHDTSSPSAGSVNWNMAPPGTFCAAHNRPPGALMIVRLTASPIPMPWALVV